MRRENKSFTAYENMWKDVITLPSYRVMVKNIIFITGYLIS